MEGCLGIEGYGIKIKNIEASTLFEYNNGARDHYEFKEAMLTKSLFQEFICENGLKLWKDGSTRDIICIEFNFGSRSYDEEKKHLKAIAIKARTEYKIAKSQRYQSHIIKKKNKRKKIAMLAMQAKENQEKYLKLTKEDIRTYFYENGVSIKYITKTKNGKIKHEILHYKMLFRSTGKAKKGSCIFIKDSLYKKAHKFLYMGIKLSKNNAKIVEISAYAPLVSSTIIDKVKINPKNILILKDVDRFFNTNVVSIETDEQKQCRARYIDDYRLKNTMFDGQALIDSSIFPDWGNGYILLRHHFCKMASTCTHIQDFFKDYFGDTYETATVKDMFGNIHFVKDIELITTDNAMKWLKFGVSYDYWCEKVSENNCMFGIVKTAHESKLGSVQKMSYQMVNSLDIDIMDNVVTESIDYVNLLKTDDDVFLDYLNKNKNFANDYEVLVALCNQNRDFLRSDYFRDRKKTIVKNHVLNLKTGKIIQNAENLVIVGSPYAMLLYAASGDENSIDNDETFFVEDNVIQCYTDRFNSGEYLAFFRSPFNSRNNLTYLHNVYHSKLERYFKFGKQMIAVNMNGTDFQDRNNGSDMDSDAGYTTNQVDIVEHARQCVLKYPTIVNNIPKDSNTYTNSLQDFAFMDNKLASAQMDIGLASNLAQLCQTYSCNFNDQKFIDYTCILSVLAQVAIDNAKRQFDIDLSGEIKRIQKDMDIKQHKYPSFWSIIKKNFNPKNINPDLICPMNCLYDLELEKFRNNSPTLPMSHFFIKHNIEKKDTIRKTAKVEDFIEKYSISLYGYNIAENNNDDFLLLRRDYLDMMDDIRKINISYNYLGLFTWLLDRAFLITIDVRGSSNNIKSQLFHNKTILLKSLYDISPKKLLKCFKK